MSEPQRSAGGSDDASEVTRHDPVVVGTGSGTWVSGLFGVLALIIGPTMLGRGSLPQLTMVMFGTLMLAATAVWALRERRYQVCAIWGALTVLGIVSVVTAAT